MPISTEPQDMVCKKRPQVLTEIRQLEQAGEFRKLRHYLIQLVKSGNRPRQYEPLLRGYLYSPEADLREAAVFCLLFALQIQNVEYRAQALAMLADEAQDFDARMWAGSGLAVAYKNTKDPALLTAFLTILDDEGSDKYLKSSCIRNVVLLLGIPSREQWLRAKSDSLPALWEEFAGELATARELAAGR